MGKLTLYVIRHGQSENNLKNMWTGWYDTPLTEDGLKQAEALGEFLKGVEFTKVYSSDLSRAVNTAKTALPSCEPIKTPLLREINVGSIANKPLDFVTPEQRIRIRKEGYVEFGGESRLDMKNRIAEMLSILEKEESGTIALFCHAGWLRNMFSYTFGDSVNIKNLITRNCALGIFEFSNGNWLLNSLINFN